MNKKIAITTLGCKVNQFESASFVKGFEEAGCTMVAFNSLADIYVINTCTVTGRAGQQSRQLIRRAMRINPAAQIVVTGCYAQAETQNVLDIVDRPVIIVGNGNKHLLVELALAESECDLAVLMSDIGKKKEICRLPIEGIRGRTRAFLRVQDGCNNFCSYCIVPYTRGRCRSLPFAEVMEQAEILGENGCHEIVITGINVGKYGLDLDENQTIYTLLRALCQNFPEIRIRLSSIEPPEVNDTLLELAVCQPLFMPHFHIPLQSGDNAILRRMNRKYTREKFAEVVWQIHRLLPNAAIGADVLCGFPGEDEMAHENTSRLLFDLPITYLHVFPYSPRNGTLAASMSGQIAKPIKDIRVKHLRRMDQHKRREFYQKAIDKTHKVLVEGETKQPGYLRGFTENYIPLSFKGDPGLKNTIVDVIVSQVDEDGVHARLAQMRESAGVL